MLMDPHILSFIILSLVVLLAPSKVYIASGSLVHVDPDVDVFLDGAGSSSSNGQSRQRSGSSRTDDNNNNNEGIQAKVVGGVPVQQGKYPFFVGVCNRGIYSCPFFHCGGSLIHPRWVLTAGHCWDGSSDWEVIVNTSLNGVPVLGSQTRKVIRSVRHPSFSSSNLNADFLLLQLDSAVTTVDPIRLNKSSSSLPKDGDEVTIMGTGAEREKGPQAPTVRETSVVKFSALQCFNSYRTRFRPFSMFCAGSLSEEKADACQGDSGSAVLDENGLQVGLASWGIGCANAQYPGVYARIDYAYEWIDSIVCVNQPACLEPKDPFLGSADPPRIITEEPSSTPSLSPVAVEETAGAEIRFQMDYYSLDIGWILSMSDTGDIIKEVKPEAYKAERNKLVTEPLILAVDKSYRLEILDTYGDGCCCTHGTGNITVVDSRNSEVVATSDCKFTTNAWLDIKLKTIEKETDTGGRIQRKRPRCTDNARGVTIKRERIQCSELPSREPGYKTNSCLKNSRVRRSCRRTCGLCTDTSTARDSNGSEINFNRAAWFDVDDIESDAGGDERRHLLRSSERTQSGVFG